MSDLSWIVFATRLLHRLASSGLCSVLHLMLSSAGVAHLCVLSRCSSFTISKNVARVGLPRDASSHPPDSSIQHHELLLLVVFRPDTRDFDLQDACHLLHEHMHLVVGALCTGSGPRGPPTALPSRDAHFRQFRRVRVLPVVCRTKTHSTTHIVFDHLPTCPFSGIMT